MGNDNDGYTVYDYQPNGLSGSGVSGSSSSGESRIQGGFSNITSALDYLNSNRSDEHNFDKAQKWNTTPTEDAAARQAANSFMGEDYSLFDHNCYDLGPDAIIKAINEMREPSVQIDISNGPIPNTAFNYNNDHGAIAVFE